MADQPTIPPKYAEIIDEFKKLKDPSQAWVKRAAMDATPDDFWMWLVESCNGAALAAANLAGVDRGALARQLDNRGIPRNHTNKNAATLEADRHLEDLLSMMEEITNPYEDTVLDGNKDWMIFADIHCPTTDPVWLRRGLAVAKAEGVENLLAPGDFGNYDAMSHFALKQRGTMPRLQDELNVLRPLFQVFKETFPGDRVYMLTNHEQRILSQLKQEIDGDDLFSSLLKDGKFVDDQTCLIGDTRFIHPDRGRKVLSSQANEFTMAYEQSCYIAHSHRYFDGFSNSGRPCGMLGGLFWKKRTRYYMKGSRYVSWENAFWMYKDGRMIPFPERTDWSKYGVA